MSIPFKIIYRFNVISIKIPMAFFHRKRTYNSKIYVEPQKILNNQSNLEKEENARDIIHPDFKLYYKAIVIKQYDIGIKRDTDWWNGIDSPEIDAHAYGFMTKKPRIYNGEKIVSLINSGGKTGEIHVKEKRKKEKKLDHFLISYTKINSKQIKGCWTWHLKP